jgi:predicted homoserine dehydrogenase-like protein
MYRRLAALEESGKKIRVGLVGAGSMGVGIAYQVAITPGMELAFVGDIDIEAAHRAADAAEPPAKFEVGTSNVLPSEDVVVVSRDSMMLIERAREMNVDVLVESTNSVNVAAHYCNAAIDNGLHVVLMNAEVDLAIGHLLNHRAAERGLVVTSDAGDQHGVLARMIDEIRMWGFDIVMAGNIKGFLDRYATAESLAYEAQIRNLNPVQCAAYTDGTKLCVEMCLIGNGEGLVAATRGMAGPRAETVQEVFDLFDFEGYGDQGVVDYILGAQPGGGVYVVGRCDNPLQAEYLKYYKMGEGPWYLFYRPYHLCHLETPFAIASAVLDGESLLSPWAGRLNDTYAFAKRDLKQGDRVEHGIGGDHFYGMIDQCAIAAPAGLVPMVLLEAEGEERPVVTRALEKDEPLTFDAIELPESYLLTQYREQEALLKAQKPSVGVGIDQ